jgi:anti-sigma factor RsiW
MPSCATIDPLVTPYVDGELPPAERERVDAHLRVCPPCRSRVAAEKTVCELLGARRAQMCDDTAPDTLRAACRSLQASRHAVPPVSRARSSLFWTPRTFSLAIAATFLLIIGSAITYRATAGATRAIAAELTADHVKCFMLNNVLGTHESVDEVEAYMRSGFDWVAELPRHPEEQQMQLVGSRPCLYEHGKIAHIMYEYKGLPVSIFMLPGRTQPRELIKVFGYDAVVWSDQRQTYVLIAKAPRPEVERVASFVQASLR